jgi:N-acetylmuramoyl-L-alanine amidase
MVKQTFVALLVALSTVAVYGAVPPVRTMYNDAVAKETAVRKALDEPQASEAVLKAVHEAVATYEAVVRHYPASAYSDNALWQAARLALDAFARFHQPVDRDAAARLLRRLTAAYPSSRLARQAAQEVARLDSATASLPVAAPPVAAPDPAPSAPLPPATVARPSASGRTNTIRAIRRTVLPDAVRVVIELDGEVAFHQERIPDPSRVFVDLAGTRASAPLVDQTLRFESDADVVRQVRIGRHPNNTTRVVLDAAGVSSYSVYPLYDPYRLVIDCVREGAASVSTGTSGNVRPPLQLANVAAAAPVRRPAAPLTSHPLTTPWLRSAPSNASQHGIALAEARAPEPPVQMPAPAPVLAPALARAPELPPGPPAPSASAGSPALRSNTGGLTIARQLGLSVSRIVIDAGHGGHDPGAKGRGVTESELVLDVALRLEKLLQQVPGVEVILTRRTDDFIQLPERTAMANREGADLFLSIHANASTSPQARGVETYFLNFATNLSAAAVAARENASSTQAMGALPDFVKAIALNNKVDESRDFATAVQHAMIEHLRPANKTLKDLGVKQAPFVVLIGAAMPSVLAEISFVSNPQEARLVKSSSYRQHIAEALFTAIRKYQTSLKTGTAVASQR